VEALLLAFAVHSWWSSQAYLDEHSQRHSRLHEQRYRTHVMELTIKVWNGRAGEEKCSSQCGGLPYPSEQHLCPGEAPWLHILHWSGKNATRYKCLVHRRLILYPLNSRLLLKTLNMANGAPAPSRSGLSLYANLLDPSKSAPGTISGAPVTYKKPAEPSEDETAKRQKDLAGK